MVFSLLDSPLVEPELSCQRLLVPVLCCFQLVSENVEVVVPSSGGMSFSNAMFLLLRMFLSILNQTVVLNESFRRNV